MKWMYVILIVMIFGIVFISYHTWFPIIFDEGELINTSDLLFTLTYTSQKFAIYTGILETIAIIIGILGFKNLQKTSLIIILTSLPMLFWSYLMYQKPTHISIDEVILAWVIYMIGLIVLAVIGFRNYKKIPEEEWDENILDDGI